LSGYVLSDEAEQDFEDIVTFVAADSIQGARKVVTDIEQAMVRLGEMPRMGHVRADLAESDVRFWVVHSYLIVYRAEMQPIQILRIVSGFRDLVELLA
jgi:plasmid stabilization system protein ParE